MDPTPDPTPPPGQSDAAKAQGHKPGNGEGRLLLAPPLGLRPPSWTNRYTRTGAPIPTLAQLLILPGKDLMRLDLGFMNLLCATELPGTEDLDLEAVDFLLNRLQQWGNRVRSETERNAHRFPQDAAQFRYSEAQWRVAMGYNPVLGVFLQRGPAEADQNAYRYAHNNPVNEVDPMGLLGQQSNPAGVVDVLPDPANTIGADLRVGFEGLITSMEDRARQSLAVPRRSFSPPEPALGDLPIAPLGIPPLRPPAWILSTPPIDPATPVIPAPIRPSDARNWREDAARREQTFYPLRIRPSFSALVTLKLPPAPDKYNCAGLAPRVWRRFERDEIDRLADQYSCSTRGPNKWKYYLWTYDWKVRNPFGVVTNFAVRDYHIVGGPTGPNGEDPAFVFSKMNRLPMDPTAKPPMDWEPKSRDEGLAHIEISDLKLRTFYIADGEFPPKTQDVMPPKVPIPLPFP